MRGDRTESVVLERRRVHEAVREMKGRGGAVCAASIQASRVTCHVSCYDRILARNQCLDHAVGPTVESREIQYVVHAGAAHAVLADLFRQLVSTGCGYAGDAGPGLYQLLDRRSGGHDRAQQWTGWGRRSVVRQRKRISGTVDDHADPS